MQLLLFESFGGFGKGVREILRKAADVLQNKLTRAQYLDEVTWTTKSWLGLQKQRISVVLHTAIAEQIVNELANGEGGRVHGAKCLAVLAGRSRLGGSRGVPVLVCIARLAGGGAEKRYLLAPSPWCCKQRRATTAYRLPVPLGTPPLLNV